MLRGINRKNRSESPDLLDLLAPDHEWSGANFVDSGMLIFKYDAKRRKKLRKNLEVSTEFSTFADKYNLMGTKEKLVERFKKKPKDFTYEETIALLAHFGYEVHNKGATSGSRVRFKNETKGVYIDIHRPHPGSIMKEWMIKAIYQHLKEYGHIK